MKDSFETMGNNPQKFSTMILKEWETDTKIDETQLNTESLNIPKLHSKYLNYFFHAKNMYRESEKAAEKMLFLRYQWYEGKLSKDKIDELKWDYDPFDGLLVKTKEQRSRYFDSDEVMLKYKSHIDKWKQSIDLIEKILGQITWRHQIIKQAIDFQKMQNGLI
jgi:hypothetical protein